MASACSIHGVLGILNGRPFEYAPKKTFWIHDTYLPLPDDRQDFGLNVLTFGGDPSPLNDGIYFVNGRVILHIAWGTDTSRRTPTVQVFANDVSCLFSLCLLLTLLMISFLKDVVELPAGARAPPMFVITGRVSRSSVDLVQDRMFDIDVSQYGAENQQVVRVRCQYPPEHP